MQNNLHRQSPRRVSSQAASSNRDLALDLGTADDQVAIDPYSGPMRFWTMSQGRDPEGPKRAIRPVYASACPDQYCRIVLLLDEAILGPGSVSRQMGTVRVRSGPGARFKKWIGSHPQRALSQLRFNVSVGELSKREAVELLLPALADAPSRNMNDVFEEILALGDPSSVLEVALDEYDRTGRQRFISLAVSALEQSKGDAWPALATLARSDRAECEPFVNFIATYKGVSVSERKCALHAMLHHPSHEVRALANDALAALQ